MIRKITLPVLLLLLAWAFFINPTIKEIAAGVAILLFGMIMLEEGFNSFAGGPVHSLLKKSTNKFYKSLGLGFLVTALLQSSSLISVITISFLSAGLIGLNSGIGIIFGANIGTTATAWLVASFGLNIDIAALSMPMLAFGIVFALQRSKSIKGMGYVLAGLGFFFLGIHFMKLGFHDFHDDIDLSEFSIDGPIGLLVYTSFGIVVTLVLQSSSAAMALILTALAAGQITYFNSLALAIGANIGTTVTAIIGSISSNFSGKRLAAAHFIFNIITGIVALLFIVPMGSLVEYIAYLMNVADDNFTIKLALFHSIFNVLGVILMLPFIGLLIRWICKLIPDKKDEEGVFEYPEYLNQSVLAFPQTALQALLNESKKLFENAVIEIVCHGLNLHRHDVKSDKVLKSVVKESRKTLDIDIDDFYYKKVKIVYSAIIEYATLAQGKFTLSSKAVDAFIRIQLASRKMVEIIKDLHGLRENVSRYMISDNEYIQKEYDRLRIRVSKVLREIYLTGIDEEPASHLKRFKKLKNKSKKGDVLIDGTLEKLIRENKVSSIMATSLANDSDTVKGIIKNLIEIAELIYIQKDTLLDIEESKSSPKLDKAGL